ncbi:MAG: ABC transporter ATP-binding protein [Spirochaetaceae bacterium]|nr:ABC transporter ATP-binding protein [Spirochaetaceae bacterium]
METFKRLKPYLRAGRGASKGFTLFMLAMAALTTLLPAFLHRVFFDRVIPEHCRTLIFPAFLAIISADLLGAAMRLSADRCLAAEGRERRLQERIRLVRKLMEIRVFWHQSRGSGAVIRHFEDAGFLGDLRPLFLRSLVGPALTMLVLLPGMFFIQPLLALGRILVVIPALVLGVVFLERDLSYERRVWNVRRRLASALFQGSAGAADLKSVRCGSGYHRHLRSFMEALGQLEEKRSLLNAGWEAAATVVSRIGTALTLLLAIYFVLDGRLSFGSYIAFSIIAGRCMAAMNEFLGGLRSLARAGNSAGRHKALFSQSDDVGPRREYLGAHSLISKGLDISNLHFAYHSGPKILRNLGLEVGEGERVWLRGGSGAGKSTLFALLLGHFRPDGGTINWNGQSLIECPWGLRALIVGSVPQEPMLFRGTVRDNLCLFGPAPSDRRLWQALESAGADDIVAGMSGGLHHHLAHGDGGLSGGQRQRLALARLMLRKPPLILLDEPVNALDSMSASKVSDSLESACLNRTVLIIHHAEKPPLFVHRRVQLADGIIHA